MKTIKTLGLLVVFLTTMISCNNDDDSTISKVLLQTFNVSANTKLSIPAVYERSETGNLTMELYDDNSLEYSITIYNLASSDALTAAHIHIGDLVSTGDVLFALVDGTDRTFSGNTASGTVALTSDQIASLVSGSNLYLNIHSMESGPGLLRGQVGQVVDNAYNVALSPLNEIPAVEGRDERGTAVFRIVGTTMYYNIMVTDLSETDAIVGGHFHSGTATENGGLFIDLEIVDNNQINTSKSLNLSNDALSGVNNNALYVNIHSSEVESGLLRGQLR